MLLYRKVASIEHTTLWVHRADHRPVVLRCEAQVGVTCGWLHPDRQVCAIDDRGHQIHLSLMRMVAWPPALPLNEYENSLTPGASHIHVLCVKSYRFSLLRLGSLFSRT